MDRDDRKGTEKKDEMGVGGIAGFTAPLGVRKRKKKVDEMLALNGHVVGLMETIAFMGSLDESRSLEVEGMLDSNDYARLAEMIKERFTENALRHVIRQRIRELVRKQDDGKFALYAPNPGKKKGSKKVGEFPTRAAARRAELQRFPPKDPEQLQKRRKEVEKMRKDPSIAARPETEKPSGGKGKKKEAIERIVGAITESLFREERQGSDWDEYVDRLSKQAVLSDKTLQSYQKKIAKRSEKALKDAVKSLQSALSPHGFDVDDKGVKRDTDENRMYVEISIEDKEGTAAVGPVYISMENGHPEIEATGSAKASLTRLDPERGKILRAELITVQEEKLDNDDQVAKVVDKRDEYLSKMESRIDQTVSDMSALEITMLKRLLVKKYRKIS